MKMITLENRSKSDIIDYKIEEARRDQEGNIVRDENGNWLKTDRTLEWTIKAGETVDFPDYVADYLMNIYGQKDPDAKNQFLVVVGEATEKVKVVDKLVCQWCGKKYTSLRGKALHIAARHPDKL